MAPIVFFCLCLLAVPVIQASYFKPCYRDVRYSVEIEKVNVLADPAILHQDVLVRYKAYSGVDIPKHRVRVDTFLTSESTEDVEFSNSHSFCKDTECPILRGDTFDAEFRQDVPRNTYGPMSLLMRLVDKINGRELTCIVINFNAYYDRAASETQ